MKKCLNKVSIILTLIILITTSSCYRSVLQTGVTSEENRIKLANISKGMSQGQVLEVMGYPHKLENKKYKKKRYDIWYYVTQPVILGQSQLVFDNFTPVIFHKCKLIGWGKRFYRYFFDVDNIRDLIKEEKRQAYTDDRDEWPRNEHQFIAPMNEPKKVIKKEEINLPKTKDQPKQLDIKNLGDESLENPKKPIKKPLKAEKELKAVEDQKSLKQAKNDDILKPKVEKKEEINQKQEVPIEHPSCKDKKEDKSWKGHENKYNFWE